MINGLNQFYLTEVAWTVHLGSTTCLAEPILVHGAHQVIVDAVGDWVTILLVGALVVNRLDSLSVHLLTTEDGQSQSVHLVQRNIRVLQSILHLY
jgi:hypothetical protein